MFGVQRRYLLSPNLMRRLKILGICLLLFCLAAGCISLLVDWIKSPTSSLGDWVNSPRFTWYQITGLSFPASASIVMAGEYDHGSSSDRARWIVLHVDASTIQEILRRPPPWGGAWSRGPLGLEVVKNLQLTPKPQPIIISYETGKYWGMPTKIAELITSKSISYAAKPEKPGAVLSNHYGKGRILIVDPVHGELWANAWDFSGF